MSISMINKSINYLSSDNIDIKAEDVTNIQKPESHQEPKIDLNRLSELMSSYPEKQQLSNRLALPYGLPIDTFSELDSPLTVKITTTLGKRLTALKSKADHPGLLENVTDKAEVLMHADGQMAEETEKNLVSISETTGNILIGIISQPINAAKEKIQEVVEFAVNTKEFTENVIHEAASLANKSTSFILHIPGLASEVIGNKVARVYEKAGQKFGHKVEPITNTLANVSRAIGHSVHNFSDNISSMVEDVIFPTEKEK